MSEVFSEDSLRKIASQKITYRYSVRIHATAFVFVNILLFLINILSVPEFLWALYPLLGWQIGIVMHSVLYILYARGIFPMALRGVIVHLVGYICTMLLLLGVDLNIMSVGELDNIEWSVYPGFFWGMVVILHIIVYMTYFRSKSSTDGGYSSKKERLIEKEMEKMRKKLKQNK